MTHFYTLGCRKEQVEALSTANFESLKKCLVFKRLTELLNLIDILFVKLITLPISFVVLRTVFTLFHNRRMVVHEKGGEGEGGLKGVWIQLHGN